MTDDLSIIQKVIEGDRGAYAELVGRYQDRIFRLCRSLLRSTSDAEDAAQEVFLKAYTSLGRFQKTASFYTWLYRIASNHCLDVIRSSKRRPAESWDALLEEQGEKMHELLSPAADPRRAMEASELIGRILALLRPNYRLILTLREIEGLSYQEISDVLDCSIDSVKAQLRRGRAELEERARHFFPRLGV